MARTSYLIGLGSNRGYRGRATPEAMLAAAVVAIAAAGIAVAAVADPVASRPLGGRGRRFANTAVLATTTLDPPALLARLKAIERTLGRRRGRRWGDRTIDLDLLAWSEGRFRTRTLVVPHRALATRPFALQPAAALAPDWRDPVTGRTLRQQAARLTGGRRLPRSTGRVGGVRSSVGRASDF